MKWELYLLSSKWRRIRWTLGVVICVTSLLALIRVARGAMDVAGSGDIAVVESYTFDALHAQLLVGPYSRFEWHHPGPAYFYLLAPFYALSQLKASGLAAGALELNLIALVIIGWVAISEADSTTAILLVTASAAYAVRLQGMLASAWNPHVIVLPMMASIVLAAGVAAGRVTLLPLLVFVASVVAQTHVGALPAVLSVCVCAVGIAVTGAPVRADGFDQLQMRRSSKLAASVCLLLWSLPIAEQIVHVPGNLSKLWHFFASSQPHPSLTASIAVWADAMTGWLQPGFKIPLGLPKDGTVPITIEILAAIEVLLVGVSVFMGARLRRSFAVSLAAVVFSASATTLWSVSRIAGGVFDHQVFWMSCVGPLMIVVVLDAVIGSRALTPALPPYAVWAVALSFLLLVGNHGVSELRLIVERSSKPFDPDVAAQTIADEVGAHVRQTGQKPLIAIDQPAWEVAAGAISQLQKSRIPFSVEKSTVWMFTDILAPTGDEAERILVSTEPKHREVMLESGAVTIAARRGYFADATPLTRGPH